jgi:hypothetical protein
MQFIKIKNEWIPIVIAPIELELTAKSFKEKRNSRSSDFREYIIAPIRKLCLAYKIHFRIKRISLKNGKHKIILKIKDLDIKLISYGNSKRIAIRNLLFKLHREYCRRIKNNKE